MRWMPANSNLNEVLGEKVATTLGDIREEVARAESMDDSPIPASMSKTEIWTSDSVMR